MIESGRLTNKSVTIIIHPLLTNIADEVLVLISLLWVFISRTVITFIPISVPISVHLVRVRLEWTIVLIIMGAVPVHVRVTHVTNTTM